MRLLSTLLSFVLIISTLQAQVSKDATVPMTATLNSNPISVTLTWENPGNANLLVLRRTKGQAGNTWVQALNVTASNLTTLTDNTVANGQTYEYVIQRALGGIFAFGYAHVAINSAPVNSRGKILIFVDSTTADALGPELIRLKNDMRGDGWWPIAFHTGPSSTVQSIKNQIVTSYNEDPANVKSVLLLGTVPIPYSGDANWDGHAEHAGAWPADTYYADVNGTWTDATVNNTSPARAANDNIPGDGKFDQSYLPSPAELQVGRVDFRRLDAVAFGAADHIGLMKRYLDKNHNWRVGNYIVENKALIDDNFGYFGGEAFASNGFRNAYPLVGDANIVSADFFNDTNPQSYLLGYGTGGGSYQSAGGVGSSANFATDSVNIVFSNLFGSYHGDWDFETNPFMPAALASRGGILTCSWAGRPHWFNQALASGETIGYCTLETMNAQYNAGYINSVGRSGAHVALLGDPTLRANVVQPATNLVVTAPTCNTVLLSWTASSESVLGYLVYRSDAQDGPYTRLTTMPITATTYTDNSPTIGTWYYQVRAVKMVTNPGGGTYTNNAVGPIKQFVFTGEGGPTVTSISGVLTCENPNTTLNTVATPGPINFWNWIGPNGFTSTLQNPSVSMPGLYTVVATDAQGCTGTYAISVLSDNVFPSVVANVSNEITCTTLESTISVEMAGLASATIAGPNGFMVNGFTATTTQIGTYTVTGTSATNGCTATTTVSVVGDNSLPVVSPSVSGIINCANTSAILSSGNNEPDATFMWIGPNGFSSALAMPSVSQSGQYTVVVSIGNCSATASATVVAAPVFDPSFSIGSLDCDNVFETCVEGIGGTPPYSYTWSNGSSTACTNYNMTGNVMVTISDSGGCSTEFEEFISTPLPLEISFNGTVINCNNAGQICSSVSGGVAPYTYGWSNGVTTPCNTLTSPGNTTLTITDTRGCTAMLSAVITQAPSVSVSGSVIPESGPNLSNGAISLTVAGGTGSFIYDWSNAATTQNITGLGGGTYTVTVTDTGSGCTETATFSVSTSSVQEQEAIFEMLQLSPNPSTGHAVLSLKLHESAAIRVEIRDVAGRLLQENSSVQSNMLTLPIDLTQSPAGLYAVVIWVDNQAFVQQLAKVN